MLAMVPKPSWRPSAALLDNAHSANFERHIMTVEILKALEGIEAKLKSFDEKAEAEIKSIGKVSSDTQTAL